MKIYVSNSNMHLVYTSYIWPQIYHTDIAECAQKEVRYLIKYLLQP